MDGDERRTSQYGTPYQTPGSGHAAPGQPMGPPSHDRFSQTSQSPARSDAPRSSVARPYMPGYSSYPFQEQQYHTAQMQTNNPIHVVEMSYNQAYLQDSTRSHQMSQPPSHQQYSTYGHGSMLPPMGQDTMYESLSPHYQQQRHSAAVEVMTSHFAPPTYMQPGDQGAVGFGTAGPQYLASQAEHSPYESLPITRPQLQPAFTPTAAEYLTLEQPDPQGHPEEGESQEALNEGMRQYEAQIRATFGAIAAGRVVEASETLIATSRWFLSSIRALGFHHDDQTRHEERIATWREFNHAWEALGQKQKDMTENQLQNRQHNTDLLSGTQIKNLINELIKLCDPVEALGLVDYEMGVWEEQIVSIFSQCLDLLPSTPQTAEGTHR